MHRLLWAIMIIAAGALLERTGTSVFIAYRAGRMIGRLEGAKRAQAARRGQCLSPRP